MSLTRIGTASVLTTDSDDTGNCRLLDLDAGSYRLEVTLPGCAVQREVEVLSYVWTSSCRLRERQEAIEVTAQRPVIETDRARSPSWP